MQKYDTMIIGHSSLDYNIDYLDEQVIEIGGAVVYSSASAFALGHSVLAVTKLAKKDESRLNDFAIPRENILCIYSEHSTSIRNKFFTADKERRECACISLGEPFTIDDIPEVECGVYHLAGLIYGDFDGALIRDLAARGKVAIDVQAMLRHSDSPNSTGGKGAPMYFCDWAEKKELLPYITYLKTDAAEAEIMTGTTDRALAAKMLHDWGAEEVVITHNTEVLAYDGKDIYTCPIRARNLSGRSGRGDTTFAAYITERLDHNVKDSLLVATGTVSMKMENRGPIKCSRADIMRYIDEFYPDYKQ